MKGQAITKLNCFIKRGILADDSNGSLKLINNLKIVIKDLMHEGEDLIERRKEFIKFTRALNKNRGQNILDFCPEIKSLFS